MKDTPGKRLKAARKNSGYLSATDAAESLGLPYATYAAHENGSRAFDIEAAPRYARKFKVTVDWLLTGHGNGPDAPSVVPVMGLVGAGGEVSPEYEQVPEDGLDQIEVPFPLPGDMIAFKVVGISMLPRYDDGDVIVVWREQRRALETFYGEEAAVRTAGGHRFLKRILKGANGVDLFSFNDNPRTGVQIEWIGEIYATIRATQFRRLESSSEKLKKLA